MNSRDSSMCGSIAFLSSLTAASNSSRAWALSPLAAAALPWASVSLYVVGIGAGSTLATSTSVLTLATSTLGGSGIGSGAVTTGLTTRLVSPLDAVDVDRSPPHAAGTAIRANKMQRNCDFMVVLICPFGRWAFGAGQFHRACHAAILVAVRTCRHVWVYKHDSRRRRYTQSRSREQRAALARCSRSTCSAGTRRTACA